MEQPSRDLSHTVAHGAIRMSSKRDDHWLWFLMLQVIHLVYPFLSSVHCAFHSVEQCKDILTDRLSIEIDNVRIYKFTLQHVSNLKYYKDHRFVLRVLTYSALSNLFSIILLLCLSKSEHSYK